MKVNVYKRKEQFHNWKDRVLENGIPELSQANSDLVIQYVLDMESGQNIAKGTAKGGEKLSAFVQSRPAHDMDCTNARAAWRLGPGVMRRDDGILIVF